MKIVSVSSVSNAQNFYTDTGTRVCHSGDDKDCTSELASGGGTTDTDAGFADFFVPDKGTRVCHSGDDKDCTSELASGGTTTDTDAGFADHFVRDTGTRVCHSGDDKDCTSELASGGTTTDTDAGFSNYLVANGDPTKPCKGSDGVDCVSETSSGGTTTDSDTGDAYFQGPTPSTAIRTVRTATGNNVAQFFIQDTGTRICHSGDDKDCTSELASGGTTTDTDADARSISGPRVVTRRIAGDDIVGFQIGG